MAEILMWVSIITGGLLILLMLLSLLGGLDLDVDIDLDVGDTDVDTDPGGLGVIKGALTFVSVSAWVMKILLVSGKHPGMVIGIGLVSGALAFLLLHYLFKLLLKNEENVNWSMDDAMFQKGKVYVRIPSIGDTGIAHIDIKGAHRELKARSFEKKEIASGAMVVVMDVDGEYVLVQEVGT